MSFIELVAQRRSPSPPAGMQPPENAKDWYRIENAAEDADETDIYVYDAVGGWFGLYAEDMIRDLKQITTSRINVRLNSPGGSVFEGIAIANALRAHPANVTVYVDSLAASIASVIMLAGDKIVMRPQSQVMIHNASGACYGDATEMTKMADLLDKQSLNIAKAYAEHTGRPVTEWQQYMADETWFSAEEAVAVGLADEAMPMKPKKSDEECAVSASALMTRVWDLSMYRYAGRENAPEPVTVKETPPAPERIILPENPVQGTTLGFEMFTRYADQLAGLVRAAVHAEFAEVFDSVSPSHSTAVEDGTWDAGANEKRLPSPVPLATVKKMYTYWDAEQVEDGKVPKSACKLPHHFVSEDGTPGAASANGVRNALARLPQTQGLSDAERSAAEAHLRKHLNAFKGDEEDHAHNSDNNDNVAAHQHSEHAPKFAIGDRVKITVDPHEEGQDTGTIAEINDGPAYGIRFGGGTEHGDEVHHWYVEDEIEAAPEENPPDDTATVDEADDWKQTVGFFASLTTSPCADDVFAKLKEAW